MKNYQIEGIVFSLVNRRIQSKDKVQGKYSANHMCSFCQLLSREVSESSCCTEVL